ncbi:uncharacterized protein LOC143263935 [Megachile rotundata]|uniref:uncharacterized protein LOC143263935 n=1 Tax=Megachile rotundata TaxID=143995 RepID=UPI003FD0FAF2
MADMYIVALSFNNKLPQLGESKSRALKRLMSLETKFRCDEQLSRDYQSVLQEYLDLGHMSEISTYGENDYGYFLPRHGVTKVTSDTTKLRVVFDGSTATKTAPYLAIRCLVQLVQDEGHRFPQTAHIVTRDFYVDDLLTGTATIDEALML